MSEKKIVERMFRATHSDRRVRLENAVIPFVSSVLGCDQVEAEAYAERKKYSIWNRVVKRREEEYRKGLYPTFEIQDQTRFELSWYPATTIDDDDQVVGLKRRLACRGEILDYIDDNENVSWREYEALGCVICQLAGASHWHLTPPGNDWNIDFLALVPALGETHLLPSVGHQIRVVGQSKKWTSPVPPSEVRLLADTIDDIRKRSEWVLPLLPPWFIAARAPLVGVMVAHSGAYPGGDDIATYQGLIVADSRDIVEIACLSQTWDARLGTKGAIDCLANSIAEVLSQ